MEKNLGFLLKNLEGDVIVSPVGHKCKGKAEREVFPLSSHGLGYFDGPTSFSYRIHLSVLGIPFWSLVNSQFAESGCFVYIFHFWKPLLTNVFLNASHLVTRPRVFKIKVRRGSSLDFSKIFFKVTSLKIK